MSKRVFSSGPSLILAASMVALLIYVQPVSAGTVHATTAALAVPVPAHPMNESVIKSTGDSLTWSPVAGATTYLVEISVQGSFASKDSVVVDSAISKPRFRLSGLIGRVYYWRVRAADAGDTSAWSAVWSFDSGLPPSAVLTYPQSQSDDRPSPITLRWSAAFSENSHLQLAIYRGDFSFSPGDIIVDTTISQDSLVVGGLSLGQTYYWRVSGENVNGTGPWSTMSTFVTSPAPSVSLLQPGYGSQLKPSVVKCEWLQVGGAVEYELQISTNSFFNTSPVVDTTVQKTAVTINGLSYGGSYYWRVRARSNVGGYWGTWSSSAFFTLPAAPRLTAPADQALSYAVNSVFRWKEVAGAAFYQIQIAYDSSFSSTVLDSTSASSMDSLHVDSLRPDTAYFWHVRGGSNDNGWSDYSKTWTFTTSNLPPNYPVLQFPHDSSSILPLDVVLSWEKVTGADEYLLQVSTDSVFSTLQLSDSSITADSLRIDSLKMGTKYYWRVGARSKTAGWGNLSPARTFTTKPYPVAAPVLSGPPDSTGNHRTSITLSWAGVTNASIYQVQVSPDSALDTLVLNDTAVVADSVHIGNLVRGFRYYWHVRAGRSHKSWGPYSQLWTFNTEPWTQKASLIVDTTMNYPRYNDVSQFKASDYKLFGLPGHTNLPVTKLLRGTPGKDWQAYTDNGDTSNYLVKYSPSLAFEFGLGNGFWLIHNGPWTIDTTLNSAPLDSIGQVKVYIHPGWNIITDPYLVDVPWDSVQALNGRLSRPVWAYNRSFNISNTLVPFDGYYYFNADTLKYLIIPYMEPKSSMSKRQGPLMRISSLDSNWTIRVTLTSDGIVDSSAWLGVSGLANPGFNRLDVRMPSGPGFEPSVYFSHPDWDRNNTSFASDIRPAFADSNEWNLTVDAVPGKSAVLDFSGLAGLPDSFAVYLRDRNSGTWSNLKQATRYDFVPKSQTSTFNLLIGRKDLVNSVVDAAKPVAFRLENNYPNPFNPTTVIGYVLPARSRVTLDVYNVLGQRVVTLVDGTEAAGEHTVHFNGSRFASGVYFYRLIAGNHVFTKKMVLLK